MRELDAILFAYDSAKKERRSVVLATVIHVEGSSYRRAGARMLVDEFGSITGAISGGCLEGDALRKALHALHQNQNRVITYDTGDEEDAVIGAQLGCNGIIQVLFEPINFNNVNNPIEILKHAQAHGQSVVATFFHLDKTEKQIGTTCWMEERGNLNGLVNKELYNQLLEDSAIAVSQKSSLFREYILKSQKHYVFLDLFLPPLKLVLVGAGNDAQILAQMAGFLGWDIVVIDGRHTHAKEDRFADSCQVIVSKPEEILKNIKVDERVVFVLMTHNYNYDLAVLKHLIEETDSKYIGILGPRKKYDRMLQEMNKEPIELSEEKLAKVYAPVGLELGAETPAEIALAILAEIQAVIRGTQGSFLKKKEGPIHQKKNNDFKQVIID
ncbi:MAG: XdhC/CoxI family protein [Bacteroidota bacterium]